MYSIFRQVSIVLALASAVRGSVPSISGTFEITSPAPNAIFVAGQVLPIIYSLSSDIAASQSAGNTLNTTTMTITPKADVSQSAKATRTSNNVTYYEHAVNFPIPIMAPSGMYNVIFADKLQQTNTTIPITIRPEAQTPSASEWFSPSSPTNINNLSKDGAHPSSFLASGEGRQAYPALCPTIAIALMSLLFL